MEETDNIEKITLEKQKKPPLTEKQRENLKRMRERKRELSMTRVKSEPSLEYSPPKHTQPQPHHRPQPHNQPQPYHQPKQKDLDSRITDLERDLYEIKLRKKIKTELKTRIAESRILKSKSVDKDTIEEKEMDIKENTHAFNYNSLFY